jgi:hypothetical protein
MTSLGFQHILTCLTRVSRTKVSQSENGKEMWVSVESWKQVSCWSQARISFWSKLLGQFCENEARLMIPFILVLNFKEAKKIRSVLHFWTEFVLSERLLLKLMLTSNDTDLGEEYYTKVVDNYDTFPASIYTHLSNKCSMSNDLRK